MFFVFYYVKSACIFIIGCRCLESNPCEHNCIDTGVAVQCSCDDGYELQKDKKSCKGILINIKNCLELFANYKQLFIRY